MIVSIPILLLAVFIAAALAGFLAWTIAASRANAAAGVREAELARLSEQARRLPELIAERDQASTRASQIEAEKDKLLQSVGSYESTVESQEKLLARRDSDLLELQGRYDQALAEQSRLGALLASANTALDAEQKQSAAKLALLEGAKDELSNQFKALANEILEDKSRRFTDQNQANLAQLLDPLKTQLDQFRTRVDEVYVQESNGRSALTAQVKDMMEMNRRLSQDADNLTRALKGSSKTQGNWGELILERILEASGLRKGVEYTTQESYSREDGSRGQPDVVIHLPEDKHLIVDSKVSLTAYSEYMSADTDAAREAHLGRHIESLRNHIKSLSEKKYQALYGLNSLDHVILFVPIESAFILATSGDIRLWEEAWRKNVLLVCPSTFLFVVRTVNHLWRQEHQNRNVQEIAQRGAALYDKFVAFVDDLQKVGQRLTQTKDSFDLAFNKLSTGRGNLVRQAEHLRDLGVRPSKRLPTALVLPDLDEQELPSDEPAQMSLATVEDLPPPD
jgi:DNA recombination protein RmuC